MCIVYNLHRRAALVLEAYSAPMQRSLWCRPRSLNWWENVWSGRFGEVWWKENLRMSRGTFDIICRELKPHIEKQATYMRQTISVEKRVAVTLWRLATTVEHRTLSELFGLGWSTVGAIVIETCDAIADNLFSRYVSFPTGEKLRDIISNYETCWGFPQVAGAIDRWHIPIVRSSEKGYYSVIMPFIVKGCMVLYFPIGSAWFLGCKYLYSSLVTQPTLSCLGMMKPYAENVHSTAEQKRFNYRQSWARMPAENAFGRLKGRMPLKAHRLQHSRCPECCCCMCGFAQHVRNVWRPLCRWLGIPWRTIYNTSHQYRL